MNRKKLPNLIILFILTLITILFWISFSIYQVFTSNTSPVVPTEIILQIDPKLDIETIKTMRSKI
jgi:hypothetical protein